MTDRKIDTFEYILLRLIDWYLEEKSNVDNPHIMGVSFITESNMIIPSSQRELNYEDFNQENDFNILKVIKLLYFVTAVNAKNNKLLTEFNTFVAMPYGHVESEIYDYLRKNAGVFPRFKIEYQGTTIKNTNQVVSSFDEYKYKNRDIVSEIEKSLELLKKYNGEDFILYEAYDYVNMSHALSSWKLVYNTAKKYGLSSSPIEADYIKNDGQVYILQSS